MEGQVRQWCAYQRKCKEDSAETWTCTSHLDSGLTFQCRADPAKVTVTPEGYFRNACEDFEPPGYNYNDPEAFGPRQLCEAQQRIEQVMTADEALCGAASGEHKEELPVLGTLLADLLELAQPGSGIPIGARRRLIYRARDALLRLHGYTEHLQATLAKTETHVAVLEDNLTVRKALVSACHGMEEALTKEVQAKEQEIRRRKAKSYDLQMHNRKLALSVVNAAWCRQQDRDRIETLEARVRELEGALPKFQDIIGLFEEEPGANLKEGGAALQWFRRNILHLGARRFAEWLGHPNPAAILNVEQGRRHDQAVTAQDFAELVQSGKAVPVCPAKAEKIAAALKERPAGGAPELEETTVIDGPVPYARWSDAGTPPENIAAGDVG